MRPFLPFYQHVLRAEDLYVCSRTLLHLPDNTCTDQDHHTCSAEANYGGVSVDWNAGEVLLGVYTPHENNKLASSVTLDI
jgi:hypothetical protein